MTMTGLIEGKRALVTGASRGIGREVAIRLARQGADVAIGYVSNDARANEVAETVSRFGRVALPLKS
jgi:3-oxoacyl-[acyl-carrier protein] reductase